MKLVRCKLCRHYWFEWRSDQACPKCAQNATGSRWDVTEEVAPAPQPAYALAVPAPVIQQHQNRCTDCGTESTGYNYCPACGGINVPLINGRPVPRGSASRPVCQICHRGRLVSKSRFQLGGSGGCLGLLVMIPIALFMMVLGVAFVGLLIPIAPFILLGAVIFFLFGGTLARRKRILQCTSCGAVVNAS